MESSHLLTQLLYGLVLWFVALFIAANLLRVARLVPASLSTVQIAWLLTLGSLLAVLVVLFFVYFGGDPESETTDRLF